MIPQETLPAPTNTFVHGAVYSGLNVLLNAGAYLLAAQDRSWGALGILFVGLPVLNLGMALVASLVIGLAKWQRRERKLGRLMSTIWSVTGLGWALATAAVLTISAHGC